MNNKFLIVVVAVVCTNLCACASRDGNPASNNVNDHVAQINEDNASGAPGSSTDAASTSTSTTSTSTDAGSGKSGKSTDYEKLMEAAKEIDLSGKTFAPGDLPVNLSGVTFCPRCSSTVIQCVSNEDLSIISPSGQVIEGKYRIKKSPSSIEIMFDYESKNCSAIYSVTTCDDLAMLHLENIEFENKPLPLLAVAKLRR